MVGKALIQGLSCPNYPRDRIQEGGNSQQETVPILLGENMPNYRVTLTHKEKIEIGAETPEDALKEAIAATEKMTFAAQTQTVKELPPEE